jgi:hypothetical protein
MTKMVPITELASVIRSKNAGPFELTMDIIFKDQESFELVRKSEVINCDTISRLYQLDPSRILVLEPFEKALSYKITIVRPVDSGSTYERDTYGAAQHAPLLMIKVPLSD